MNKIIDALLFVTAFGAGILVIQKLKTNGQYTFDIRHVIRQPHRLTIVKERITVPDDISQLHNE